MPDALMMLAVAVAAVTTPAQPSPADLSVMSYNVHGLPWPIAVGRSGALERIGRRLGDMRRTGEQPHIVLLQEAFTSEAKAIAQEAGYPFVVGGPKRNDRTNTASGREEKLEDSGLLILSDYPVLEAWQVPYARPACAGFDCLANKGIVMVRVLIPGTSQPLTVLDTHLNSRRASGAGIVRANAAFGHQANQLREFIERNISVAYPAIVAGDFNVGKDAYRRAVIRGGSNVLPGSDEALRVALSRNSGSSDLSATRTIVSHGKDYMFVRNGSSTGLTLQNVTVPFGPEPNGKNLSDHYGYVVHFIVGN